MAGRWRGRRVGASLTLAVVAVCMGGTILNVPGRPTAGDVAASQLAASSSDSGRAHLTGHKRHENGNHIVKHDDDRGVIDADDAILIGDDTHWHGESNQTAETTNTTYPEDDHVLSKTKAPTPIQTAASEYLPTPAPTAYAPTARPTHRPTHLAPTPSHPTHEPTHPAPTPKHHTSKPTNPTASPVYSPTKMPQMGHMNFPSKYPTLFPSAVPTTSSEPTLFPTHRPTHPAPTKHFAPTIRPTDHPTEYHSGVPTSADVDGIPVPTVHFKPTPQPSSPTSSHGQSKEPTHRPTHPAPTKHPEPTSSHGQSKEPTHRPTHPAPTKHPEPTATSEETHHSHRNEKADRGERARGGTGGGSR